MVVGAVVCLLVAGTLVASGVLRLAGWLAGRLGLRRWRVQAPYVIVDGEPLRLGSRVTFGAARRLARAQRGARIYDCRGERWVIEGRRWSERENGYLGEVVDAELAARLLGVDDAVIEEILDSCGLEPEDYAGRDAWRVTEVLEIAARARIRSPRTSESVL